MRHTATTRPQPTRRGAHCTTIIRAVTAALVLLWAAVSSGTALAQARVVTSIKPLQMIASAITDGVSEPQVLIPSNQSYHHFTLRPSTLRTLRQADLFVWVGPELETYLSDAVVQGRNSQQLQVLALPELRVHHAGMDGEDSREILIPADGLHAGHQHKGGPNSIDPHVWLDTRNAVLIAEAIAGQLVSLDPGHAATYQQNLTVFAQHLANLEQDINTRPLMSTDTPYAVYHNAFQYFERQFGLQHDVVFVESEELQPGVRHMMAVRQAVASTPLSCLMEDVTTQAATVDTLLGDKQLRRIRVDTLGQNLTSGPMAYIHMMDNLADAFRQCAAL